MINYFLLETEGEGDTEWLRTVLKSGTVTDKMAAMTIRLQRASFYRLKVNIQISKAISIDSSYSWNYLDFGSYDVTCS